MTAPDPRARLEAREAELIRALRRGQPPPGLDARMVAMASAGITRKRTRQLARTCPALIRDLGPTYEERFAAFAQLNPPCDGGAIVDGLAFGSAIAAERALSKAATIELMLIHSSVRIRHGELRSRPAPYVALKWLRQPAALIVVIRVPRLGLKVFST